MNSSPNLLSSSANGPKTYLERLILIADDDVLPHHHIYVVRHRHLNKIHQYHTQRGVSTAYLSSIIQDIRDITIA